MGANILLTGASGFLGSFIMKEYSNFPIKGLGRTKSDFNVDLACNIPSFEERFDIVIHSAGKAHIVPKSEEEILEFRQINVVGTKNLLKGLTKTVPKQFVFISSVSVYGVIEGESINETSPLICDDPYGESKVEAEEVVKKWCQNHDVLCTILRLPLIVGVNPPGNLGSMIHGIQKGYYFNIAGGTAKKSMVLATDIAKFILNAAEVGGTYNLTDGYHPNFNELSHCIAKQMEKKLVHNIPMIMANFLALVGDRLGQKSPINSNKLLKIRSSLTFDDSKAREAFGWNPTPVLKGFNINE